MDFYSKVPKNFVLNLKYRRKMREQAMYDEGFQRALWSACRHDVLFWMNAFVWVYEPRPRVIDGKRLPTKLPFITWDHQDPAIRAIKADLGLKDIGVEKSRGEGMSWIAVLLALHDWMFEDLTKVGMVSSTEKKADNPEDPDSLFWKLDWELLQLPRWMAGIKDVDYKRNIQDHTLTNLRNGSRIAAYSATGDVARGGRAKWFLMDELGSWMRGPDRQALASTQHVTDSRLVVSTPMGAEGAYYDMMHEPSSMTKIILDWKDNPWRNRGLYTFDKGKCVAVDPKKYGSLPPDYESKAKDLFSRLRTKGFKLDGTLRSEWYDNECDRPGATPQAIAQELDRDYGGAMYRIFGHDFMGKAQKDTCAPFIEGDFHYDLEDLSDGSFDEAEGGPMKLWMHLAQGEPRNNPFDLCADIAAGLGGSHSSNSVLFGIDTLTMEQVLEYATNTVEPRTFADLCIAVAYWLGGAYMVWEHAGPGTAFTRRVLDRRYANIYHRENQSQRSKKKQKTVGWVPQPEEVREDLFSHLHHMVRSGELKLRSRALVAECGQYVRLGGKITHIGSHTTEDDSSKGKAHGDRVIACGVALQGLKDRPITTTPKEFKMRNPPQDTLAWRVKQWEQEKEDNDPWNDNTNWDLTRAG